MIYSKLFEYLSNSPIWDKPLHTRIVWITMNSLANKVAHVKTTADDLAIKAGVSEEDCNDALNDLINDHLITKKNVGWIILDEGLTLPDLAKECERREYQKHKTREYREKAGSKETGTALTPKPKVTPKPNITAETWAKYSEAYRNRYRVEPVRNATTNSQMKKFVDRIGISEAPNVAEHYIYSNNSYYISRGHSVGILLADAEKLRTECATKTHMTNTQANAFDKRSATQMAFQNLIDDIGE